jgi:transposase
MGAQERFALEGFAAWLSIVRDLLAKICVLVRRRHLGQSLAKTGQASRPERRRGLEWELRGRHVCLGKKGGDRVGPTKRGKGTKLMVLVDGTGLPLAIDVDSASPADVRLIEPLIDEAVTPEVPGRLIYDRAADSDPLRQRLANRGIELICPHRRGRIRPRIQDGRPLRRFRRRWIVERTIGWLQSFRRLVTRYEYYSFLFHGFAKLACLMIVLRRFWNWL